MSKVRNGQSDKSMEGPGHEMRPEKWAKPRSRWALISVGPLRAQSLASRTSQNRGKDKETNYCDAVR